MASAQNICVVNSKGQKLMLKLTNAHNENAVKSQIFMLKGANPTEKNNHGPQISLISAPTGCTNKVRRLETFHCSTL